MYKTNTMKQNSSRLIDQLITLTHLFIDEVEALQDESLTHLNYKQDKLTWSVLETLEHLNLYGDFYIPEISNCIKESSFKGVDDFKSGVLGGYFVNILKPREKLNTMKTLKDKNPNGSKLDKATLERFLNQQKQMLSLLKRARQVDLTKTKTAISISKWIKLRLGDTLGVVVFHNERHIEQVKRTLRQSKA